MIAEVLETAGSRAGAWVGRAIGLALACCADVARGLVRGLWRLVARHPLAVIRIVVVGLVTAFAYTGYIATIYHNEPEDGLICFCLAVGLLFVGFGVDEIETDRPGGAQ